MTPEQPTFRVVWRGYDRRQVDEFVRRLPDAFQAPVFDVVFRGYDRRQVEAYLAPFLRAG